MSGLELRTAIFDRFQQNSRSLPALHSEPQRPAAPRVLRDLVLGMEEPGLTLNVPWAYLGAGFTPRGCSPGCPHPLLAHTPKLKDEKLVFHLCFAHYPPNLQSLRQLWAGA